MALSGTAITSLITAVAAASLLSRSDLLDAAEVVRLVHANPSPTTTRPARNFFIGSSFSQRCSRNRSAWMVVAYETSNGPNTGHHWTSLMYGVMRCKNRSRRVAEGAEKIAEGISGQKNKGCEWLLRPFAPHSPDLRCSDYHQTP